MYTPIISSGLHFTTSYNGAAVGMRAFGVFEISIVAVFSSQRAISKAQEKSSTINATFSQDTVRS
jgi:hypothetical protein